MADGFIISLCLFLQLNNVFCFFFVFALLYFLFRELLHSMLLQLYVRSHGLLKYWSTVVYVFSLCFLWSDINMQAKCNNTLLSPPPPPYQTNIPSWCLVSNIYLLLMVLYCIHTIHRYILKIQYSRRLSVSIWIEVQLKF